ncbi:MAG: stage II sporulation protein M [Nitrososphaerota archaeon]|nr:stage II sporulation protein M [Nitrososphaerota archaeon]MDG6982877.1 stage II sporulation protein M [Nitrososphaerota archaeon]
MSGVVAEAPREPDVGSEVLVRRRVLLVVAVLLVEIGIFFVGLFTPLSAPTRQALANQTNSQFGGLQGGSSAQLVAFIFTHNLSIALAEMIPVAGEFLFGFSVYSTGLAAQSLVASQGLPAQWGAVIFAFPYSLVELSAYSVAVVSGSMLIVAWRRHRLKRELRVFVVEGLMVVCILLVAAAMEVATVRVSYVLGFALWLPMGVAVAVAVVISGRRRV